jgi:hypothetical protein
MTLCDIQECKNAFCASCVLPNPQIKFICPRCHVSINDKQPIPYVSVFFLICGLILISELASCFAQPTFDAGESAYYSD